MADFAEQLKVISIYRQAHRQRDDALYRARLDLQRTTQQLRRARQKETIADSDRDRQLRDLRLSMAQLESRLAGLREDARQAAQWFAQLAEQERLLDYLQQNHSVLTTRITALRQQIATLRQQVPPPAAEIARLLTEVQRAEQMQDDIARSLTQARDRLHQFQQEEAARRSQQEATQGAIALLRGELGEAQSRVSELLQPAFEDAQSTLARHNEVVSAVMEAQAAWVESDSRLQAAIAELYEQNPHPEVGLQELDDRIPFLLFPIRFETIFVPTQAERTTPHTELWVRLYPDEIAVHTHEKTLTDWEVLAGELYWTELITAEHLKSEQENRRQIAWRYLVDLFGGQRATWIAAQSKPSDWEALVSAGAAQTLIDFLTGLDADFFDDLLALELSEASRTALQTALAENDGDAFSRLVDEEKWSDRVNALVRTAISGFPVHDLTKTDAWTRAPRTHVLPDRFVLRLYPTKTAKGISIAREVTGNLIPDTVFLGPDPLDAAASFIHQETNPENPLNSDTLSSTLLTFGVAFNWMSDFERAVAQGMAFRVTLTEEEALNGFAKIYVLGVRLSTDAVESAALVEELIDNLQFSPKGFSLVPQGTPTNNTDGSESGYSDNDPYDELAFLSALDPPAFDAADPDPKKSQTDGRRLADALGISYAPLQSVQSAGQTDLLEAYSLNTVLFPGTLGYWLRSWMAPIATQKAGWQTRSFFTRYVSGRGPLPAVRVGNQPYGILLTSDFSRWKYTRMDETPEMATSGDQPLYLQKLHQFLAKLEGYWEEIAATLPYAGMPDGDPEEILMDILGLQPTSVEFFQRIGYSSEYLRTLDNFYYKGEFDDLLATTQENNQENNKAQGKYAHELISLLESMPIAAQPLLQDLGFDETLVDIGLMGALRVLWQRYTTQLDPHNLVEKLPLSESNMLKFNYIEWFANAENAETIISQAFDRPAPTALLYLMMRNALLLQMHEGAYEWLVERADFDPQLQLTIQATTLAGMSPATPTLSKLELMTVAVESAEPSTPSPGISVATWIWNDPLPAALEAAFLKQQKAALQHLTQTPTARLERCLVEHLDCCSYRLDAWQTGLFAQRLQAQRRSGEQPSEQPSDQPSERQRGLYIGAFGWVENVLPSTKVFVNPQQLPRTLRLNDGKPVLEEDDIVTAVKDDRVGLRQGGFFHTPSLNHASAAALLRNAYLSHATPEEAEMFSTNLSSERVRRGQFLLEGLRNGQPLEALLGYQFERKLHDLSSESMTPDGIPLLALNQYIVPYREAFPLEALEVTQVGTGESTEVIPPYNVVNGLRLMQATLFAGNGYGLEELLPANKLPSPDEGSAIMAARGTLLDSLDAVTDLLMAENAYQLVRGNFDRVAAVSLSQKEAHIPPDLEVIATPRGSEFTFTNRVTLHFDDLDPTLASSNPWPAIALTPRAIAETGMNHWLGGLLGSDPQKIRCDVYWVEKSQNGTHNGTGNEVQPAQDRHAVTLADLGLQPLDFAWLVGSASQESGGATELEMRIAHSYRRAHMISDDRIIRIELNAPVAEGEISFARLFPLARHLRSLLSKSRALHAEDFLPAVGGKATAAAVDKNNPKGYLVDELRARVLSTMTALVALADAIDGPSAPSVQLVLLNDATTEADDEPFVGSLGAAFSFLEEAKIAFTDRRKVSVTFLLADAETLLQRLQAIANFGISDAFPPESDLASDEARASLLARAHRVARGLRSSAPAKGVLDRAAAFFNLATNLATGEKSLEKQVLLLSAAGKILFGDTFTWLPKFRCHNEIELAAADADRAQLLAYAMSAMAAAPGLTAAEVVEEWLQGLVRVRQPLHEWEVVCTLVDALSDQSLDLRPVQVPYRSNDSWLAVEFPEKEPNDATKPFGISHDTLSIVAHGSAAFQAGKQQCGVLLDDWSEEIPTAQEITGIGFRFNQPNATPPQTLLLAVTPEETGSWQWDDLMGTLMDTLQRAKRRAVEPEQLEQGRAEVWPTRPWNAFVPALVSEFSTIEDADISLDLIAMIELEEVQELLDSQAKIYES